MAGSCHNHLPPAVDSCHHGILDISILVIKILKKYILFFKFQINLHDQVSDEQGVLTFLRRWIIYLQQPEDLTLVDDWVQNITNVAAIVPSLKVCEAMIITCTCMTVLTIKY